MKQLTAIEEIDKVTENVGILLGELKPNSFGSLFLITLGKIIIFAVQGFKQHLAIPGQAGEIDFSNTIRSSINRYLASNCLICAEAGLVEYLKMHEISAINGQELKNFKYSKALQEKKLPLTKEEVIWLKTFSPKRIKQPQFYDLLDTALYHKKVSDRDKTEIRHFFDMVRIIRNKGSHLDASLKSNEIEILKPFLFESERKFQVQIKEKGGQYFFEVTFIFYHQLWIQLQQFFNFLVEA